MRLSPCMGIRVHHLWPISAAGTSSGLDTWFILLFLDSKKLAEWLKMQGKICNLPTQFFSDPLCTQHRLPCSLASASVRVGVTHIPVMMHNGSTEQSCASWSLCFHALTYCWFMQKSTAEENEASWEQQWCLQSRLIRRHWSVWLSLSVLTWCKVIMQRWTLLPPASLYVTCISIYKITRRLQTYRQYLGNI